MRRYLILVALVAMIVMVAAAPAAAQGSTSVTLTYELGDWGPYYLISIELTEGVPLRATFQCALESEEEDTLGSIDPYLELYAPGVTPDFSSYEVWADDEGSQDCAGYHDAILDYVPAVSGTYTLLAQDISDPFDDGSENNGGVGYLNLTGIVGGSVLPFPDGRINQEQWATAAVYCVVNGNIDVYAISAAGLGTLVIRENWAALEALGIPAENELRAESEDGSIRLYRLSSGEWQINAPADGNANGYVYRWRECTPGGGGSIGNVGVSGPFTYEEEGEGEPEPEPT